MKLHTKYLGELLIEENDIIQFPNGLPGFDSETAFVILEFPGNPLFQFLQSTATPQLSFIITSPYHFYRDYEFELEDSVVKGLHIQSEKDVHVFSIVTLKEPFASSTLNLKAPIIINPAEKNGKQYILPTDTYMSKAPLIPIQPSGMEE